MASVGGVGSGPDVKVAAGGGSGGGSVCAVGSGPGGPEFSTVDG